MFRFSKFALIIIAGVFFSTVSSAAHAQSKIYGDLELIRSGGSCPWNQHIATKNTVSRVMGMWFLYDTKDTSISNRGIELLATTSRSMPNSFTSLAHLIPGTIFTYTTAYRFGNWDRRNKTVAMLKQSWIFTGWGSTTVLYCTASWVGTVKYK